MDLLAWATVGGAALVATSVLVTHRKRDQLLALLTGITAGLFAVQIANIHVFTFVVTLWWMTTKRPEGSRRAPAIIIACAIPVALTALTGDLVNNPLLGLQIMALAFNGAMIASRITPESERRMLRGLLFTCTVASLVGAAQVVGFLPSELVHQEVSGLGRPSGIYPEPDWLGLFSALGLLLAWRTTTGQARLILIAMNGLTCVLAFARAPWVAIVGSIALYLLVRAFTTRRQDRRSSTLAPTLLLGLLAVAAFTALPDVRADLASRVSTLLEPRADDVSGQARIQQISGLRQLIETAPWYGHGISSSGRVGVSGVYEPESGNSVGSNWILSVLADAKFLALPLIALFLIAALRRAMTVPGQLFVVLLINNLFSNATIQPITWMMLALALTTAALESPEPKIRPPLRRKVSFG